MRLMRIRVIAEYEQGVSHESQFTIRDDIYLGSVNERSRAARERVKHLLYGTFLQSVGGLLYPSEPS